MSHCGYQLRVSINTTIQGMSARGGKIHFIRKKGGHYALATKITGLTPAIELFYI